MTDTNPRDLIRQLADLARRKHYTCEDSWYSCPQSEDGSANKHAGTECDCGATKHNAKVDAICTALTQPEPEGPTDGELRRRFLTWWREEASAMRPHPEHDHVEHARRISEIAWANGAYVAHWGRPTPQPVSVSERLPGPEDCDAEGKCWWGRPSEELCNSDWFLATRAEVDEFCDAWPPIVFLPHWALPVPTKAS